MTKKVTLTLLVIIYLSCGAHGIPKTGIFTVNMQIETTPDSKQVSFMKFECVNIGLFQGSTISLHGRADVPDGSNVDLTLSVFKSSCANLPMFDCTACPPGIGVNNINHFVEIATNTLFNPSGSFTFKGTHSRYINTTKDTCSLIPVPQDNTELVNEDGSETAGTLTVSSGPQGSDNLTNNTSSNDKREAGSNNLPVSAKKREVAVNITVEGGIFVIQVKGDMQSPNSKKNLTANISLIFDLMNPHGYLSAVDFPALVFYGIMTGVYAIYAIAWLIVLGLNYTDLVRLQFWVLGVILLGFVEKALFLAEYDAVNRGNESHLLIILAVVISALKRSLSRMLLVIAALGYGIVRPRLGDSLNKVVGAGVVYWILATINGILRARNDTAASNDTSANLSFGLLILVDVGIMFWIFSAIVETRRTLRIRKNLVKLSIYNHFCYVLIFSVVAALGFVIWDILAHVFPSQDCLTDWSEVWLHDCFWHVLFAIILGMVMFIWRPGSNNKRFAYSLVDDEDADDDDDNVEQGNNKNFESVKMRQVGGSTSEPLPPSSHAEEDLRWVEENLPTSAIDKALPLILDSDEELMTTKLETSKMN